MVTLWRLCLVPVLLFAMQLDASAARSSKRGKHPVAHHAATLAIAQIRPGPGADAALSLEAANRLEDGSARARAHRGNRHQPKSPASELPDALLVAPNPQTAPVLAALGLPVIDDVLPIAVLNPGRSRDSASIGIEAVAFGIR